MFLAEEDSLWMRKVIKKLGNQLLCLRSDPNKTITQKLTTFINVKNERSIIVVKGAGEGNIMKWKCPLEE